MALLPSALPPLVELPLASAGAFWFLEAPPSLLATALAVVYSFCCARAKSTRSFSRQISSAITESLSSINALVVPFTTAMAALPATPTFAAPAPEIVWVEMRCPLISGSASPPKRAFSISAAAASTAMPMSGTATPSCSIRFLLVSSFMITSRSSSPSSRVPAMSPAACAASGCRSSSYSSPLRRLRMLLPKAERMALRVSPVMGSVVRALHFSLIRSIMLPVSSPVTSFFNSFSSPVVPVSSPA